MNTLILDETTKTIKVKMSGAAATTNPDFISSWADNNGSVFTEGSSDGVLNGTNDVVLVAAPGASTRRIVKSIIIENKDTAAVTLTIMYDNNGSQRNIVVVTLAVKDTWTLNGTFDSNGNLKQAFGGLTDVVNDLTPQLGGELDINSKNIKLNAAPDNVTATGLIITTTVDTNAEGIGAPLMMAADGHLDTANATAVATAPCVALALETGTGSKKILLYGTITQTDWNWTIGPGKVGFIYLNTTVGTLTQTQPTATDNVIQIVGWAITADTMMFCPQLDYITHV